MANPDVILGLKTIRIEYIGTGWDGVTDDDKKPIQYQTIKYSMMACL